MPTEAINCTSCGSADVKEVKPNACFSNHCETVFKHIDPSCVTVEQAFWGRGSAIQLRRHTQQLPDGWAQVYLHTRWARQRDRLLKKGLPEDPSYSAFRIMDARRSTRAVALSAVTTSP